MRPCEKGEIALNDDPTRRAFLQATTGAAAVALVPNLAALGSTLRLDAAVNVGVIGLGRQGRAILAEIQKIDGLSVKAVCDSDASRLSSGARRARGAETVAEYAAILDRSDIDAVFIATPTHRHRDLALAAIDAGKHVFCEAPMASTIDDCQAMAAAARTASTVFHVGMQGRSNPIYKLAFSFARSGSIRDMVGVRGQYHKKTSWRVPANDPTRARELNWRLDPEVSIGLAGEIGTQQFDVAHWFLNRYPVKVRGGGAIQMHDDGREIADTIACELVFENGSTMVYDATLANSYEGQYEQIMGTMGTMKLAWTAGWLFKEADAMTQGWEVYANRQQFHNEEGITLIADATQLAAQGRLKEGIGLPNAPLYYAIEDFLKSVSEGARVRCTADEGLRAAAVGILANQAVVAGSEVAIDPDLFKAG